MTRGATSDKPDNPQVKVEDKANRIAGQKAKGSSLLVKIVPELLLLAVAIYLFVAAFDFQYVEREGRLGPAFWPQVISAGIALCSIAGVAQKLWTHRVHADKRGTTPADIGADVPEIGGHHGATSWRLVALALALVIAYPLAAIFTGYSLATALFLMVFTYLGGRRKWHVVPLGILGSLLFTYVFGKVVYVALPTGVGVFDQLSVVLYRLLGIY